MTVKEAMQTDRQLILTLDPPDGSPPRKVTMDQPYCLTHDGLLYGKLTDGTDLQVYEEFISEVELGAEIV